LRFTRARKNNGGVIFCGAGEVVEVDSGEAGWRRGVVGYFNPVGEPAFWVTFEDGGERLVVPCSAMRLVSAVPRPRKWDPPCIGQMFSYLELWTNLRNTRLTVDDLEDLSHDIDFSQDIEEAERCYKALLAYHRFTMDPERRILPLDRIKRIQWKATRLSGPKP
jgi:hypothetical protein